MKNYNWTEFTLEERLEYLNKHLNIEKNPKKLEFIQHDINVLKNHLEDFYSNYDDEKLLDIYNFKRQTLEPLQFLWSDFLEFRDTIKEPVRVPLDIKTSSLSKEDLLDLTHDFYKSLDKYFFHHFMNVFHRRKDHIRFFNDNFDDPIAGETLNLFYTKESFIHINRSFMISDAKTVAHEYMHAISALINPKHFLEQKDIFSETDTLFIELLMSDYLKETLKDENATISKMFDYNRYLGDSEDIGDEILLIKNEISTSKYTCNKDLKIAAKNVCEMIPLEVEGVLYYGNDYAEDYLTSYIFALELYHLYKEDKEKALFYLKKLILLNCKDSLEYYNNIKALGIYPNAHLREIDKLFRSETLEINIKRSRSKNS